MRVATKIILFNDNDEKFFGEGPAQLLHAIEKSRSLRAAAMSMGMAYSKAFKLIKNAEATLGFPLTTRSKGGKNGGGSCLTVEGKEWLDRYESYQNACKQANSRLFMEFFPEQR